MSEGGGDWQLYHTLLERGRLYVTLSEPSGTVNLERQPVTPPLPRSYMAPASNPTKPFRPGERPGCNGLDEASTEFYDFSKKDRPVK